MKLPQIKIALATVWMLSVFIAAIAFADVTSMANRLALAMVGVLPALAMWFWWHDPAQTLSESIHGVRDEGRGGHSGLVKSRSTTETQDQAPVAAMADEAGPSGKPS
jgi:hypothetical protein